MTVPYKQEEHAPHLSPRCIASSSQSLQFVTSPRIFPFPASQSLALTTFWSWSDRNSQSIATATTTTRQHLIEVKVDARYPITFFGATQAWMRPRRQHSGCSLL
jgi:hypothetical protein